MTSAFPVEIWEKILKYAISVPLFFETDPASSYGIEFLPQYNYEAEYWRSERIRNAARRICSTWNAFLKRYDHRYVHIEDVLLGWIPITAIPLAIRLNANLEGDWYQDPLLREKVAVLKDATRIPTDSENEEALLWQMEIWDGKLPVYEDFDLLMSRTPRLEAIVHCAEERFSRFRIYPKRVRFISAPGANALYPIAPQDGLKFDRLTTLQLVLSNQDLGDVCWNLPSLQHLAISIYNLSPQRSSLGMLRLLEKTGKGLLTFYFTYSDPRVEDLPDDIWEMLPVMQRIGIPHWGKLYPPKEHPTRYARIALDPLYIILRGDFAEDDKIAPWLPRRVPPLDDYCGSQAWLPSRPQFEVQMDRTWLCVLTNRSSVYTSLAFRIAEFYSATETRFTDSEGVSLDEYIIFLIKWYWKGGRARRRLGFQRPFQYHEY